MSGNEYASVTHLGDVPRLHCVRGKLWLNQHARSHRSRGFEKASERASRDSECAQAAR